jgi:hypothetical protein
MAELNVFNPRTVLRKKPGGGLSTIGETEIRLQLRNSGGSPAFDVKYRIESPLHTQLSRRSEHIRTITPSEEVSIGFYVDYWHAVQTAKPTEARVSIAYSDALGSHEHEWALKLLFEPGKSHPASITSEKLDGKEHHLAAVGI